MNISLKNISPVNVRLQHVSVHAKPGSDVWIDVANIFTSEAGSSPEVPPKIIVDSVSADLPAGSLTAILGSSGSGKTTLLNAVADRITSKTMAVTGTVTFNGIGKPSSVRSAYVMQDDVLLPTLTIRETLQYAVDLRLQSLSTRAERDALVEETIMELGLKECADTRIGTSANNLCSGGEKRRTSIGVQLLSNPSVLFCDEPTTGLDAHSAFQIVQTLKLLASKGRNIIISIHAPRSEIWSLFDRVIILSKGVTLYSGLAYTAASHFKELGHELPLFVNPAEFLVYLAAIDSCCQEAEQNSISRIQTLGQAWQQKSSLSTSNTDLPLPKPDQIPSVLVSGAFEPALDTSESELEPGSMEKLPIPFVEYYPVSQRQQVSFNRQLMVMMRRGIKTTIRDPTGLIGCMVQAILMGVIYGWIFFKLGTDQVGIRGREGALFVATYPSYLSLMFEIYRLTIDIRLFDTERRGGVATTPAFLLSRRLSKVIFEDLPIPTIFTAVYYFMVGFREDFAAFWVFLAVVVATHYCAVTFAFLCVTISRDFATASVLGNLSYTLQVLCCGFIIQTDQLPPYLKWMKWIAYNFYGFVALTLNEFTGPGTGSTGVSYGCHPSASSVNPNCVEYTGAYIIQALGFSRTWLWKSVAICVCFALVFLLVAGAVLTISKNDVEVVKIKQKTEIPTHGYGNPISRPSNKVRQAVLALQEHGLEVRNRHLFARSSSKIILEPVTASFPPGKINVIMGPSGSGKTSLLRSLARKVKDRVSTSYQISGNITLNGTPATDDMIKSSISFVTQDDEALMPALTVRETLRFAAGIRLPSSMTKEQKRQRAEDLIIQMGLRQCADTMIGSNLKRGISGGEKRRVSIAIQILADPLILLLDEPTSGLDVWTANSVLDVLRALADEGRTIIMTAHQCRSDAFKTFDNVLLLARGGSVVYTGAAGNILSHFSAQGFDCGVTTNPADFILDLITVDLQHQDREDISRKRVEDLAHNWQTVQSHPQPLRESASEVGDQVQQLSRSSNPFMETFLLVLKRSGLNISRNPEAIIARTMQTIGMVLLFTLFFTPLKSNAEAIQTRMGFIQICTCFCVIGMLQNVAVYPAERDTFYREFDDGCYGVSTFLSSYTLLETPFTIVSSLIFGLLAAYAVNLDRTAFMFIIASYNVFCVISCGESLGIIFCTFFSSHVGLAMHTSSALFSFGSTMAGIVALDIPRALQIVNYLSPFKYSVINLAVYSLKGREFTCTPAQEVGGKCPISTGEQVLALYNIYGNPRLSLLILGVLVVFYRLVAYTVVKASRVEWRLGLSQLGFLERGKQTAHDIV